MVVGKCRVRNLALYTSKMCWCYASQPELEIGPKHHAAISFRPVSILLVEFQRLNTLRALPASTSVGLGNLSQRSSEMQLSATVEVTRSCMMGL